MSCFESNWACQSGSQEKLNSWTSKCLHSCVDGVSGDWTHVVGSFPADECALFWQGVTLRNQFCVSIGDHHSMMRIYEVVAVEPELHLKLEETIVGNNGSKHLDITEGRAIDGYNLINARPKQWTRPTFVLQRGHAYLCAYASIPLGTICGSNSIEKPNSIDWHCFNPDIWYDQMSHGFGINIRAKTGDVLLHENFQECINGEASFAGYSADFFVDIKHAQITLTTDIKLRLSDLKWCMLEDVKYEMTSGVDGLRATCIMLLWVQVK